MRARSRSYQKQEKSGRIQDILGWQEFYCFKIKYTERELTQKRGWSATVQNNLQRRIIPTPARQHADAMETLLSPDLVSLCWFSCVPKHS